MILQSKKFLGSSTDADYDLAFCIFFVFFFGGKDMTTWLVGDFFWKKQNLWHFRWPVMVMKSNSCSGSGWYADLTFQKWLLTVAMYFRVFVCSVTSVPKWSVQKVDPTCIRCCILGCFLILPYLPCYILLSCWRLQCAAVPFLDENELLDAAKKRKIHYGTMWKKWFSDLL